MKTLALALAASTMLAMPTMAPAQGNAYGKQPKVCLLTFESAAARTSGADTGVIKAQYVPFAIAQKLQRDTTTQAIAYYGDGELDSMYTSSISFYYPDGSTSSTLGITSTAYTQEICNAYQAYAESRDDDSDDDDSDD